MPTSKSFDSVCSNRERIIGRRGQRLSKPFYEVIGFRTHCVSVLCVSIIFRLPWIDHRRAYTHVYVWPTGLVSCCSLKGSMRSLELSWTFLLLVIFAHSVRGSVTLFCDNGHAATSLWEFIRFPMSQAPAIAWPATLTYTCICIVSQFNLAS